jgi:hypothetical protein
MTDSEKADFFRDMVNDVFFMAHHSTQINLYAIGFKNELLHRADLIEQGLYDANQTS